MLLGALVDAGVPFDLLAETAAALNVGARLGDAQGEPRRACGDEGGCDDAGDGPEQGARRITTMSSTPRARAHAHSHRMTTHEHDAHA